MKIIKIPFSKGGFERTNGCEKAPDEILKEFRNIFSKENHHPFDQMTEIEEIEIPAEFSDAHTKISDHFSTLRNEKIVALGGDHSITHPILLGLSTQYKTDQNIKSQGKSLLIFDSHPDCENNFKPPTHEDYLRVLIEDNIIDPKNVLLIGLRNSDPKEIRFLKEKGIRYFTMKQIFEVGIRNFTDTLMENARRLENLHLSIDIDVLDPAFAPGTGWAEPGGFSSREMIYIVQRLNHLKNITSIDIVEVNPDLDFNNMTSRLAAKLLRELI